MAAETEISTFKEKIGEVVTVLGVILSGAKATFPAIAKLDQQSFQEAVLWGLLAIVCLGAFGVIRFLRWRVEVTDRQRHAKERAVADEKLRMEHEALLEALKEEHQKAINDQRHKNDLDREKFNTAAYRRETELRDKQDRATQLLQGMIGHVPLFSTTALPPEYRARIDDVLSVLMTGKSRAER